MKPSTPFSKNGRVTTRVSEPVLIFEGREAAAWLAGAGYRIGLASPALYPQQAAGDIFKYNNQVCLVRGEKITKITEQNWLSRVPDGLILHRPNKAQRRLLDGLWKRPGGA